MGHHGKHRCPRWQDIGTPARRGYDFAAHAWLLQRSATCAANVLTPKPHVLIDPTFIPLQVFLTQDLGPGFRAAKAQRMSVRTAIAGSPRPPPCLLYTSPSPRD